MYKHGILFCDGSMFNFKYIHTCVCTVYRLMCRDKIIYGKFYSQNVNAISKSSGKKNDGKKKVKSKKACIRN